MSNPAPVVLITGTVHSVERRAVPAVEARAAEYDETGALVRRAVDARPGYETTDVTVLTDGGGFCTFVLSDDAAKDLGGVLPSKGETVSYVVRPFVKWNRIGNRTFSSVGFSVAGDLTAEKQSTGRRSLAAASSASA